MSFSETLRPNAGGDECNIGSFERECSACPNHYTCINASDDLTYFRETVGNSSWYRDLYQIPNHSVGSGIIHKITVSFRWRTDADNINHARAAIKTGGTAYDGDSKTAPGPGSWVTHSQVWTINPKDGEAWEWDDIDALQIGVSLYGQSGYDTDCSQVLVTVDYSPLTTVTPGTLALSTTAYIPTATVEVIVTPGILALALSTYSPVIFGFPLIISVRIAFASDPFDITPEWTDVSSDLVAFTTKRGRQHQLNRFEAGTATILLKNLHGNYWPGNEEGAYSPEVKLGKRVNIRVTCGTTYDEYTGFVRKWNPFWFSREGNLYPGTQLECVDLQRNLAKAKLNSAGYVLEKSGVRVGHVLDDVDWPAADRDIDTGKENMIATGALENVNPMEHLFKVQESEMGSFFIKGNGYTVFHERGALEDLESQATFGTGNLPIFDPEFSLDDELLYNEVRLNRVDGTEQVHSNAASILAYSLRTLTRSGLLLTSDAIVYIYCLYLVARHHDAKMRIKSFTVKPQTPGHEAQLWPLVLGLEIGQKITLVWTEADINGDYFIEGKEHSWDYREGIWVTKFQCSDAAQFYFEPEAADETLRPNAEGDLTDIPGLVGKPTHWEACEDSSTGTYVHHVSDGWESDLYNCDPLAVENVTIVKITVHALVMQEDYSGGTTGWGKALCKSGDTIGVGDAVRPDDPGSWVDISHEWALNPDTGLAWTEDEIIALQIGVSLKGGGLGDFWIRCMRVWVVVDYIPVW